MAQATAPLFNSTVSLYDKCCFDRLSRLATVDKLGFWAAMATLAQPPTLN